MSTIRKKFYEISLKTDSVRFSKGLPKQVLPESEKNMEWYYKNLNYFLTYFNRPIRNKYTQSAGKDVGENTVLPVPKMIRMMYYYLGRQPNIDYNHVASDEAGNTLQTQWIKNQDVREFMDFFKGKMLDRISNAEWTAKPISKRATSEYEDMLNQVMLAHEMRPIMEQMAKQGASQFAPQGNAPIELPEDVERFMTKTFKEYAAETCTDLSNGLWFEQKWNSKVLQAFMHVLATGLCGIEHQVINGKGRPIVRPPYQLITDNHVDDDYGTYDRFIGVVEALSPVDIFNQYPSLSLEQMDDIEKMASADKYGSPYNKLNTNLVWWNYGTSNDQSGTVSIVKMFWRTSKDTGKVDENKKPIYIQDVCQAVLIGNKYFGEFGNISNVVENVIDKSTPEFPIKIFRPNMFMGDNVSEVERIHKIQDEIDYYSFRIREMVGQAKGRKYVLYGDKFASSTPKSFFDDMESLGFTIVSTSGEDDDQNKGKFAEMLDFTLDPQVGRMAELMRDSRERMQKVMSTSDIALGQQRTYVGLGTQKATVAQNSMGIAYLFDGYLDYIVNNMYYSVNQLKDIATKDGDREIPFLIGERGLRFCKLTKDLRYEDIFVSLKINDMLDKEAKQQLSSVALAQAQNDKLTMGDYLKIQNANSYTQALEDWEYSEAKRQKQANQEAQRQQEMAMQLEELKKQFAISLEQLKQDNANFREMYKSDIYAMTKGVEQLLAAYKETADKPAESPMQMQLQQMNKQQVQAAQQAQMQQQPQQQ